MQKITFLNSPRLSNNEHDKEQNERRLALVGKIEKFLSEHSLFENKLVTVFFFQTGVSSLVSKVEVEGITLVLKIQIRPDGPKGEGFFLKQLKQHNILVPDVIEDGYIEDHYYVLLNYIEAKFAEPDLVNNDFFYEMGTILKKMHSISAKGFGRLKKDNSAEYDTFDLWILGNNQTKNQLQYMNDKQILPENEYGSIEKAFDTLIKNISNDSSVFCHNDFSPSNIFMTTPLTLFDPVPGFNNPYIDIGRSILKIISKGFSKKEYIQFFLKGYFDNEKYETELLKASLLFNAYTMIPNLDKTGQVSKIDDIKKVLGEI